MAFFPPQRIRATSETFSFPIVDASLVTILSTTMSLLFVLSSSDRIAHHKTGYGVMLTSAILVFRRYLVVAFVFTTVASSSAELKCSIR